MANWLVTISPEGGARQASNNLSNAFKLLLSSTSLHIFDCKKYLSAFNSMLKNPDETMAVDLLNQSLVVQCLQYETTHLLVPALCPITLFTLNLLKKQGITTIHWLFEDYRRVIYWKSIVAGYSWFLAVQKGPIPKLCAMHNSHYVYLPTAASDLSNNPILYQENKLKADISFVGIPSAYRVIFLEYLLSQNISLAIAGEGWNVYKGPLSKFIISDRWVNSQEAAQIIKLSSIAINLSFKEPSDDISDIQLSPLIFDILSIGVTLLTEEVPLVHETLTDCHFYTFKNKEEAVEKIHKLLSESYKENLNRQNKRNRMLITQKHTWQKRVEQIIELCS